MDYALLFSSIICQNAFNQCCAMFMLLDQTWLVRGVDSRMLNSMVSCKLRCQPGSAVPTACHSEQREF